MNAPSVPANEAGHEKRDVNIRAIAIGVGALAVIGVLLHFALALAQVGFKKESQREDRKLSGLVAEPTLAAERPHFPDPKLQLSPREDLRDVRAREEAYLNSYGWINKTAGVVRIPIDRAMDLLAERGLPVRGSNNAHESELEIIRSRANQK